VIVVSRSSFDGVVEKLCTSPRLAVDTETTGLHPYKGDRLFSIVISDGTEEYYFNFQPYEGLQPEFVLTPANLSGFRAMFQNRDQILYLHNAKFDLAMFANEGIFPQSTIHCTRAIGRVEYNEHFSYSLDNCLKRIGLSKSDAVERYIHDHKLTAKVEIPGKKTQETKKFFDRVPFDIIAPYGCSDARGTYSLGAHQESSIGERSRETAGGLPTLRNILDHERRLTATIFRMEQRGIRIDREYCVRAASFETDRAHKASESYKKETGRVYKASPKEFAEIFSGERERWEFTEKGNPSFESEVLRKFTQPAARHILEIRDAKSKADFYNGFLYHADGNGRVHPNFNQDGAASGRFSSSEPNFQNLTTSEDEELEQEFVVRRAIIPSPGFVLYGRDYNQMEYRLMFELACRIIGYESQLVKEIKSGKDPHQATADLVTSLGTKLGRSRAKNGNFALLYGSGNAKLAETIGGTLEEAKALRQSIFSVAPEINIFIQNVMRTAERRGWIFNWAGRISHFPDPRFAYRAPNYLIQGGCADINKIALNWIDEYLLDKKSKLIMTIHDEAVLELHESEVETVPVKMKELMEAVFTAQYLPMMTSGYIGMNLADVKDHK
jgi:DNA polymerase-1